MELVLVRDDFTPQRTIGRLWYAQPGPFTLEDAVHGGPKIPGETAIPEGRYRIVVTKSQRFGRMLPLLLDVPGFEGIRIHTGNTHAETSGCLLVGQKRDEHHVLWSGVAMDIFQPIVADALARGQDVFVTICSSHSPLPVNEGIPV
jgi:hypothetical protein